MVSGVQLFLALFNNLAMFIVLVAGYGRLYRFIEHRPPRQRQLLLGLFFGLFAIACMYIRSPVHEGAFVDQRNAFVTLYEAASQAGLAITGRPFAVFRETDDRGYRFEAMLPVKRPAAAGDPRIAVSESPGGYALRFVHQGSFEDIDLTYDAIASHLEAEGLEPQDLFIEEFVTGDFLGEPAGVALEATVYIYVFPK